MEGPTIQQATEIIFFLLTYDSKAFNPVAGPLTDELRRLIDSIDAIARKPKSMDNRITAFVQTVQAFGIIEKLENMWLNANGEHGPVILDYIKRVTCEVGIARTNMIHPNRPITTKDCCIFDIDDTLLHEGCSVLSRAVLPELTAWMVDLQSLGYSIILLTSRTTPHPSLDAMLVAKGIRIHRYICASSSTYDGCMSVTKRFERSRMAKKQARIRLKVENYNICLTVGNLLGDLEDVGNRYLLPERCMPRTFRNNNTFWPSSPQT